MPIAAVVILENDTARRAVQTGDSALFSLLKRKTKKKGLVGVCFTPEGLAIAHVERNDAGSPRLLSYDFVELEPDSDVTVPLQQLVGTHQLAHTRCSCVIPATSHNLLLIESPDVQPAELKAAVRWRIKDLIDFHIDDAVIDVFEIPEQGAVPGRARLMYAVAARASTIHRNIEQLEKTGLDLEIIDIPELVLRNITAMLDDDVRGVAFLHLDSGGGVLTLTRQGALFMSRNIDVGTNQMIPAIGDATLHPTTEQALDKLVLEVQRSLDYYESHFSQPPITSLVLAPMEQEVAGVLPYLSANLGMAVSMLDMNAILDSSEQLDNAKQAHCLLAIGAALRYEKKVF